MKHAYICKVYKGTMTDIAGYKWPSDIHTAGVECAYAEYAQAITDLLWLELRMTKEYTIGGMMWTGPWMLKHQAWDTARAAFLILQSQGYDAVLEEETCK